MNKYIRIGFVHEITFWAIFGLTSMYKMLHNLKTAYPDIENLVLKVVRDLKKKKS